MTIRELMEEQRRRVRSSNPAETVRSRFADPRRAIQTPATAQQLPLGELLEHEVCSNLNLLAPELTVCAEAAERLRRTPWLAGRKHRSNSSTLDGEHILHAEATLYRAGIPYLLLPFRRDRFASSTFMVSDVAGARVCLLEAGFRKTSRSPLLLIDGQTRRPIQLYQDRTESPRATRTREDSERMKKAAIYVRVSTADQHVESQLFDLRQFAAQKGFQLGQEYVDHGICGARARRPALDKMMEDARRHKFDVLLVWSCDRLARSTKHLLQTLDELTGIRH